MTNTRSMQSMMSLASLMKKTSLVSIRDSTMMDTASMGNTARLVSSMDW